MVWVKLKELVNSPLPDVILNSPLFISKEPVPITTSLWTVKLLSITKLLLYNLVSLYRYILLSSKVDDTELKLEKENVDIEDLVMDTVTSLDLLIGEKALTLMVQTNSTKLNVDKNLMVLTVKNIIENAIKYSNDESNIIISLENNVLEVINYADKIRDFEMDSLFVPFKTTDESRNTKLGGHGLGLYIIQKSLELHKFDYEFVKDDNQVIFRIDFNKQIGE